MKNIYNIDAGDVFWSASDVGWVVGHSYIVYGPLLTGATTIIYEGKPIPKDKKSLAFSIRYRAVDRTLTDEEVNGIHTKIIKQLEDTLRAELRS